MNCQQCEDHLLYEYARGSLATDEAARVAAHLGGCDDCRRTLDSLRRLGVGLNRLEHATRHDLPEGTGHRFLLLAAQELLQPGREHPTSRRMAARPRPRLVLRRLLIPVAAAAIVLLGLRVIGPMVQPPRYRALDYLYADAKQAATVTGIHGLRPTALKALDEAVAGNGADILRVANLQLVHYITRRASRADQIEDVHFLLKLLKDSDRLGPAAQASPQQATASLWQSEARAAPESPAAQAADLIRQGRYDDAYGLVAETDQPDVQTLAAYAALRSNRLQQAREAIDALRAIAGPRHGIVPLLQAELAMIEDRFDTATDHFAAAAGDIDNRLWFQAGYLCKFEVGDDTLAAQYFERTADPEVANHVAHRFGRDVRIARSHMTLMHEDYEAYAPGPLPAAWKLIPTHPDEFAIAEIDGSRVLKQNEIGHRSGQLTAGFPGWYNYIMTCDVKVLRAEADPQLDVVVYDLGKSHYALEFADRTARLQIKTRKGPETIVHRPDDARVLLPSPLADGRWWRVSIDVRNVTATATRITATVVPRDGPQEDERSFTWTDQATGDDQPPQRRGRVGFRVGGAEVAFDNLVVIPGEQQ